MVTTTEASMPLAFLISLQKDIKKKQMSEFYWITSQNNELFEMRRGLNKTLQVRTLFGCTCSHKLHSGSGVASGVLLHLPFPSATTQHTWADNVGKFLCLHVVVRQIFTVCLVPASTVKCETLQLPPFVRYSVLLLAWESSSLLNAPGKTLCETAGSLPITHHLPLSEDHEMEASKQNGAFKDALLYWKQFPFLLLTACLVYVWLLSACGPLCALRHRWPIQCHLPHKGLSGWLWRQCLRNVDLGVFSRLFYCFFETYWLWLLQVIP